jgi:hypothetical protein
MEMPNYSLPKLQKLRKKIALSIAAEYSGSFLRGITHEHLRADLYRMMYDPVYEGTDDDYSLTFYDRHTDEVVVQHRRRIMALDSILRQEKFLGKKLSQSVIDEMSLYLAGWYEELEREEALTPWGGVTPVWAPIHVLNMQRVATRKGRVYIAAFKSIAGQTVGTTWACRMTGGRIQRLIRDAGCSMYAQYRDEDLSSIWFTGLVGQSEKGELDILEADASHSMKKWNKTLQRRRNEKCKGPFKPFKGRVTCRVCPLSKKQCSLSRFKEGYSVVRTCDNGHQGYFHNKDEVYCLECMTTGAFRRKKKDETGHTQCSNQPAK